MPPGTKEKFLAIARQVAAAHHRSIDESFAAFLNFAYENPTLINPIGGVSLASATSLAQLRTFLQAYIPEYIEARERKIKLNDVKTIPDPVVDIVMEVFGKHPVHLLGKAREYHRLSMAAENKVGELLERYLVRQLEPKGWFWCTCEIIRGVDFFRPGDPVILLQVKNRSNSENSSSAAIRDSLYRNGCPVKISKWHRVNANSGKLKWEKLAGNERLELASEDGFRQFIRTYFVNSN